MRGRSYFLKTCYRTVKEIAHMALKFLQQNESLQEGVSRFYKRWRYYSAKGLEGKVVILMDVDYFYPNLDKRKEIKDRKLVYVGWLEQVKN